MNKKHYFYTSLLLIPLSFLIYFYYFPLTVLVKYGFSQSLNKWQNTFTNPLIGRFLCFTFYQAIATTLGAILLGLPAGFALARGKPYMKNTLATSVTVPFLLPPISILLGFVVLFEKNGLLAKFLHLQQPLLQVFANPTAIILAHTMYNVSVIARITATAFESESKELHDMAAILKASTWMKFRTITLHHIKPAILAAATLVFLYSFNSFAIVLILGSVKYQTLEVMIYTKSKVRLDFEGAAILAILQLILNVIFISFYLHTASKETQATNHTVLPATEYLRNRILSTIYLLFVVTVTWAPIITTFYNFIRLFYEASARVKQQLLSGTYESFLGTTPLRVLLNTLFFGLSTASIAVFFTIVLVLYLQSKRNQREHKIISFLTLLPMTTSAITISFAFLLAYGAHQNFSDMIWVYILGAHVIAAIPFATRSVLSAWENVAPELLDVSETLGASNWRIFRTVTLPVIKGGIVVATLFAFAISIGEFGATYFLARGEWITVSLAIERLFTSRSTLLPSFYATVLVVLTFAIFAIIERISKVEMKL